MRAKRFLAVVLLSGLLQARPVLSFIPPPRLFVYAFQTIDFPNAPSTGAKGINDKGEIVGQFPPGLTSNGVGGSHGFLFSNGVFTAIDWGVAPSPVPQCLPGPLPSTCVQTDTSGINNQDQIVGNFTPNGLPGFELVGQGFSLCPESDTIPTRGLNNGGIVVGDAFGQSFVALSCSNPPIFFGESHATGINDSRYIVGDTGGDSNDMQDIVVGNHGYLAHLIPLVSPPYYAVPVLTIIDFPGSSGTISRGINDRGEIVGYYTDSSNRVHGYTAVQNFQTVGTFKTFDVPGSTATEAWGVNNLGQIVGNYQVPAAEGGTATHGFLATLVPLRILFSGASGLVELVLSAASSAIDFSRLDVGTVQLGSIGTSGTAPDHVELKTTANSASELHLFFNMNDAGLKCGTNTLRLEGGTPDTLLIGGTQQVQIDCAH